MKARYFFKVLGITIFSLLLLNSLVMAQIHYDSTGNVGIGTTSPLSTLSLASGSTIGLPTTDGNDTGTLYVVGASAYGSARGSSIALNGNEVGGGDAGVLSLIAGDSGTEFINFRTGSSNRMRIDHNGNVGIGTTDPTTLLHLQAANGLNNITFGTNNYSTSYRAKILHEENYDGSIKSVPLVIAVENDGTYYDAALFGHGQNNTSPSLKTSYSTYLAAISGNVGIGTTRPESKLEVAGNIDADGFTINGVPLGTSSDTYWSENSGNIYYNSGNVGIGTASPEGKLDVGGGNLIVADDGRVSIDGPIDYPDVRFCINGAVSNMWHHIGLSNPNDDSLAKSIISKYNDGSLRIFSSGTNDPSSRDLYLCANGDDGDGGGTKLIILKSNGNVGIGTTSPSRKLDVAGNVIANAYEHHSDSRLKKNVASIDNALDEVLALRGVEFEWRTEEYPEKGFAEGRKIGLIAQEVEQVMPEVVSIDNEGYKSVEYGNIVCVLIEAIKVQQSQIEELKARIELLEH